MGVRAGAVGLGVAPTLGGGGGKGRELTMPGVEEPPEEMSRGAEAGAGAGVAAAVTTGRKRP